MIASVHCKCLYSIRSDWRRMGETSHDPIAGPVYEDDETAIRSADDVDLHTLPGASVCCMLAASIWKLRALVEVDSVHHHGGTDLYLFQLRRDSVWTVQADIVELGESAGYSLLEYERYNQLWMGGCWYVILSMLRLIPVTDAVLAIYVTMDLILSLMPIKLIMTLNRPKSEKVLIAFLMALGLCATAVSCAKMTTFTTFGSGDPMQATILPSMYAKMEEIIGIIATSLPCLKQPLQLWLHKIGVLHTNPLSRPSFVNTVPTPDTPEMRDQRSSSEGYYPGQLMAEKRGESVSVKPGSANSNGANSNGVEKTASRKEPWESV